MIKKYDLCNNEKGFSLIEVLITLALFSILSLAAWNLMSFASNTYERMRDKTDALENARLALDFMTSQIRYASKYKIETEPPASDTLKAITIYANPTSDAPSGVFEFFPPQPPGRPRGYLKYGENVLAEDIKKVSIETEVISAQQQPRSISITIETHETSLIDSMKITGKVGVEYKILTN